MVRASLIILVVALCAIAGLADSGRGQDTGGAGADSTAADSTAADSLADSTEVVRRLDSVRGFHPQYTSSYRVNRQARGWAQSFYLNEQVGPVLVSSDTKVSINEDLNRGRSERVGSSTTAAEKDFGRGFWAGVKAEVLRSTVTDQRSESEDTSTRGDLTATYSGVYGPLKADLRAAAGVVRNDVYGRMFLRTLRQTSENGATDSTRVDSTRAEGTSREFSGTLTYRPAKTLRSTAVVRSRSSYLDSRAYTFFRGRDQTDTVEVAPNDDSTWLTQLTTNYDLTRTTQLGLDLKSGFARNHRYVVRADFTGTETQTREDRAASFNMSTVLPLRTSASGQVFWKTFSQEFARQRDPNSRSDQQGLSVSLSRKLPFAVEGSGSFSADLRKSTFEVERFTPNDVRTRQLGVTLKRDVGPRFGVAATTNLSLISYFYHPRESQPEQSLQDRDDYRQFLDLSAKYKPAPKFDTSLSLQRTNTRTVNIDAKSSGNNSENERYQIMATVTYLWSARTQVSQRYSISADYSQLAFRQEQNSLTRETKVSTQLSSTLSGRTELRLDHNFRFRDSGNYTGTPRLYGRALTDTQQDLQVQTRYKIVEDLAVSLRQRMEVRRLKSLATGDVSRSLRLELIEGFNFNHSFSSGLSIDANFNRTDSYLEQPLTTSAPPRTKVEKRKYWVIQTSLTKQF